MEKEKTMETPRQFAERYLKRLNGIGENEELFPTRAYTSDLIVSYYQSSKGLIEKLSKKLITKDISKLERTIKLTSLNKLNIKKDIKERILITLYELTELMNDSNEPFREINKKIVKQRKDTIKYLERALNYKFLDFKARTSIMEEAKRLKRFDASKQEYNPLMASEFTDTLNSKPAIQEEIFIRRQYKKIEEMVSTPLKIKAQRPYKFFLKVIQIVIFTLIKDILPDRTYQYSADIINEFWKKQGFTDIATLTAKDIDNAVHGTA